MGSGKPSGDTEDVELLQRYVDSVVSRSFSERWTKGLTKALDKFSIEQYLSYLNNGDHYGLDEFRDVSESSNLPPVGLENLGATCYANVLLQALFQSHYFRKIIYSAVSPNSPNDVWSQLQTLFVHLQYTNRKWINPEPFIQSMAINARIQQDTPEFFKNLLAKLKFCVRSDPDIHSRLHKAFSGESMYINSCLSCHKVSKTQSEFHEIDLYIRGKKSLTEALKFYSDWELVQDAYCSYCKSHVCYQRCFQIVTLPPILTVQLLRYTFQEDKAKKIQSNFSFPLSLKAIRNQLGGFDFEKISEGEEDPLEEVTIVSDDSESYRYNLTSVMVHRGNSASSGHYICYSYNRLTESWIKFDDRYVSSLNAPNSQSINSSFMKCAKDAYMLMYTREDVQGLDKSEVDFDGIVSEIVGSVDGINSLKQVKNQVMKENEEIQARLKDLKERKEELEKELKALKTNRLSLLRGIAKSSSTLGEDFDLSSNQNTKWMEKSLFSDWFTFKRASDSGGKIVKCEHGLVANFSDVWVPVPTSELSLSCKDCTILETKELCLSCLKGFLSETERQNIISYRLTCFNSLRRAKRAKNASQYLIQSRWVQDYFKEYKNLQNELPYYSLVSPSTGIICQHNLRDPRVDTMTVNYQIMDLLKSFVHPDAGLPELVTSDLGVCMTCWDQMEEDLILAKTTDEYVYLKLLLDSITRASVREEYFDDYFEGNEESFHLFPSGLISDIEKYLKQPLLYPLSLAALLEKYQYCSAVGMDKGDGDGASVAGGDSGSDGLDCGLLCAKHKLSCVDIKLSLDWRSAKKRFFIARDELFHVQEFGKTVEPVCVKVKWNGGVRSFSHEPAICTCCSEILYSQMSDKFHVFVIEMGSSNGETMGETICDSLLSAGDSGGSSSNNNNNKAVSDSASRSGGGGRKSKRRRLTSREFKVPIEYGDTLNIFQMRIMELKGYPPLSQKLELIKDNLGKQVGMEDQSTYAEVEAEPDLDSNNVINLTGDCVSLGSGSSPNNSSPSRPFLIDSDAKFSQHVKPLSVLSLRIFEQLYDDSILL